MTFPCKSILKSRVDVQKCIKLSCYSRYFHEIWYEGVKLDPKWLQKFLLETDTRWQNYSIFSKGASFFFRTLYVRFYLFSIQCFAILSLCILHNQNSGQALSYPRSAIHLLTFWPSLKLGFNLILLLMSLMQYYLPDIVLLTFLGLRAEVEVLLSFTGLTWKFLS